jgi:hypothetical protein
VRTTSRRLRGIAIRGALGACVIVVCSTVAGVAHAAVPAARQVATGAPRTQAAARSGARTLYWGAWIGNQLTGNEAPWDASAVTAFEHETGKGVSLVNFSSPFANCYSSPCRTYPFDTAAMNLIRSHGAIPFFSWGSDSLPVSTNEPNFSLASIVAGTWDSYITSWAQAAKAWGHPFFLRFDWEMNANWFPWSVGVNGNTAAQYVAAWRHVHDIFTKVGTTNATWVWCPNIDPNHQYTPLASLYPGNGYVDWTGIDGYNWASPWLSFDQLFHSTYTQLSTSIAPSKPIVIAETASSEHGGAKATWITDVLTRQLPDRYPQIHAFLWFDKFDSSMDWPIETSSSAVSAFATGISSNLYAANTFAALGGSGPIQPMG